MSTLHLTILGLHPEPLKEKKQARAPAYPGEDRLWQWPPEGLNNLIGPEHPIDPDNPIHTAGGPLAAAMRSRRRLPLPPLSPSVIQAQNPLYAHCPDDPSSLLLARFAPSCLPEQADQGTAALALQADLSQDARLRAVFAERDDIVAVSQVAPVHWQAGADNAVLMGARYLAVQPAEWSALQADLNAWWQADGMTLYTAASGRHYLGYTAAAVARVGSADLPPLGCALNRQMGALLEGAALRPLRRWLTELQMWLYAHPVNAARAASARPEINSLWLWGRSPWQSVWQSAMSTAAHDDAGETHSNRPLIYTDAAELAGALAAHKYNAVDSGVAHDGRANFSQANFNQAGQPEVLLSSHTKPDVNKLMQKVVPGGQGIGKRPLHIVWSEPLWCYLEGDVAGWQAALNALENLTAEMQQAGCSPRRMILDDGAYWQWQPTRLDRLSTLARWFRRA